MPDLSCSSERDIWASWLLEGRFRDTARCRSSRESLMWSANRKSCGGLVVMVLWGCGDEGMRRDRGSVARSSVEASCD
jgi:hypothetical protein